MDDLRASLIKRLRNMRGDFLGDGVNPGVRVSELLAVLEDVSPERIKLSDKDVTDLTIYKHIPGAEK